jgi:hypothetical protein
MKKNVITIGLLLMVGTTINAIYGQSSNTAIKKDSTAVASGSDRNVMLNAADNKGPREINIGLPSTVGGTTIIENGLPVVYYFWPQLPTTAWRADASIGKIGLLKMGEVAITTGDIGFAVNTETRLGGDKLSVSGQLSTNHFGLIRATANVSGPIKDGWGYTASSIVNLDPGTYDLKFKTWEDNTQIHRLGITKRLGTKGEISLLYKYARSASFSNYGPFFYKKDGKISELDNFRLGRDSYLPSDGIVRVKELFGDKYHTKDLSSADAFTDSHTLDLLGNYQFDNNLKLKYVFRYHNARSVTQSMRPTVTSLANDDFVYADNPTEEYKGKYVQGMLAKFSERKTPVRSFTSRVELSKKTAKNSWRIGINEWYYSVDKFSDNSSSFYQEVASAPRKLIRKSSVAAGNLDPFYGYNGNVGYHNGYENKLALYATNEWKASRNFMISAGARFTHYTLNGDFLPYNRKTFNYKIDEPVKFHNTWYMKAFTLNAVYNITSKFGVLAEATYNEDRPRLENYSGAVYPSLKLSSVPMGQVGVFFNHDMLSVVSALTYIKKTNYQKRLTLTNPNNDDDTQQFTTYYDIATLGWTTDIVATPVKNFNLHLLLTIQKPAYKNYSGVVDFNSTDSEKYDYSDKIVSGVSKVLIEIDPSYKWKNLKIWASARYFSKQYANLTNSLFFAGRWETFAGLNYKYNKHFDYGLTVVNPLGQRGAKGSINGSDLATDPEPFYGTIVSGSYIRPFTVEGSVKFRF